jgi:AraC family transcriptional regulator of adaptative response/methylated-DNA-[protein]-cysteine methyltransferase
MPDDVSLIADVCDFIRANLESQLTLAELGRQAMMSPPHLQRVFKRVVGVSPRQFADACRLDHLKANLKKGATVTTAMTAAGYGSSSRLYEKAGGQLGMTPRAYRRGGLEQVIRFTSAACEYGRVFLAGTERGVSWLSFNESDADGEGHLRTEYPNATLTRDDAGLHAWLAEVLRHLDGDQPHLELPLDVRATAFQRRVWEALRQIPYGETRTYQEVAEALGQPTAARAVARACATNPASVVVPCHRVLGTDGKLHGYRWGLNTKRGLLKKERRQD